MRFNVIGRDRQIDFSPNRLVLAGFSGRDRDQVLRHIRELESLGVPTPAEVPQFYEVPVQLLTTANQIRVQSSTTSGEAEPVLLLLKDEIFLTVGSDHTARDLETHSIQAGKQACPKIVAREVVDYEIARQDWDRLRLRSWVEGLLPYQDALLSQLLSSPVLLSKFHARFGNDSSGLVLFLGTVPLLSAEVSYSDRFEARLSAPGARFEIACSYRVHNDKAGDADEER